MNSINHLIFGYNNLLFSIVFPFWRQRLSSRSLLIVIGFKQLFPHGVNVSASSKLIFLPFGYASDKWIVPNNFVINFHIMLSTIRLNTISSKPDYRIINPRLLPPISIYGITFHSRVDIVVHVSSVVNLEALFDL